MKKQVVIIGAGVAGLTAALELSQHPGFEVSVFESEPHIGGIARTVEYKGNYMDIGGHRFFSKSDRVMTWWLDHLPLNQAGDKTMHIRHRVSRIYYHDHFFNYPITLSADTLKQLGLVTSLRMGLSYLWAMIKPIKPEKSLEDFIINRFGRALYETFFKSYTEKVWGVPCRQIKPEWGQQRIKGISIKAVLLDALKSLKPSQHEDVNQQAVETSLIKQFYYPKYGVGQMWVQVADLCRKQGVNIILDHTVEQITLKNGGVTGIGVTHTPTGTQSQVMCDVLISSMPLQSLIMGIQGQVPPPVKKVAQGLMYRDFISVGLLLNRLVLGNDTKQKGLSDHWIYIQDERVTMGRIQIFNNWSPDMCSQPDKIWIGIEYFCNEGDPLWSKSDEDMIQLAIDELVCMGATRAEDVVDGTVVRMPKAYPSYFGAYDEFDVVKDFITAIDNLYPIGRNGMHRYNNMDHSMLTAMYTVDAIVNHTPTKEEIWQVNAEKEYHETK